VSTEVENLWSASGFLRLIFGFANPVPLALMEEARSIPAKRCGLTISDSPKHVGELFAPKPI
jgi:hypothetical protein